MTERPKKRSSLLAGLLELFGEDQVEAENAEPVREAPQPKPDLFAEAGNLGNDSSVYTRAEHRAATPPEPLLPSDVRQHVRASVGEPPRAQTPPARPTEPVGEARSAAAGDDVRLASPVVAERRAALVDIITGVLHDGALEAVILLADGDPDTEIRRLALQALGHRPHVFPADKLHERMRDPVDEVRAEAVRLAAAQGQRAIDEIVPFVSTRRWPVAQRAALDVLPDMIVQWPLRPDQLDKLLASVADMESFPSGGAERAGFARLAQAVGRDRLVAAMSLTDKRRSGAGRLLMGEGSPEAIQAAGAMPVAQPAPTAAAAPPVSMPSGARVAQGRAVPRPPEPGWTEPAAHRETEPTPAEPFQLDPEVTMKVIASVARLLVDPDKSVRAKARATLDRAGRDSVRAWAGAALHSRDLESAQLAARVSEEFGLVEFAREFLERATALPAEARGQFMSALSTFALSPDELVGLMSRVDAGRRHEAIRVLWQVGGIRVLPTLKAFLSDSSGPVRLAVLELIGESGEPSSAEVAQHVLETDASAPVRAAAVKLLARADPRHRVPALERALADTDPDVRATAVENILPGTPGIAELLARSIEDTDERVWRTALRHLAEVEDNEFPLLWTALRQCSDEQRGELLRILETWPHERLAEFALQNAYAPLGHDRAMALEIAGRAATKDVIARAIEALRDPDKEVRRTAARVLTTVRTPEAIPALKEALDDPEPRVRIEVIHALSVVDDDEVIGALIGAMQDPVNVVQQEAAEVLIRWSSPAVARRLIEVLPDDHLGQAAEELLAKMGMAAVAPLLEVLVDDTELAPTVGKVLAGLVGPDEFLDRLRSLNVGERLRSVAALGAIGGPRGISGLVRALGDPVPDIRLRALRHLAQIGDPSTLADVVKVYREDPVIPVVDAAEQLIQQLSPLADDPQ